MKFRGMMRNVRIELAYRIEGSRVTVEISGSASDQFTRKVHDLMVSIDSLETIRLDTFIETGIPITRISRYIGTEGQFVNVEIETKGIDIPSDMAEVLSRGY